MCEVASNNLMKSIDILPYFSDVLWSYSCADHGFHKFRALRKFALRRTSSYSHRSPNLVEWFKTSVKNLRFHIRVGEFNSFCDVCRKLPYYILKNGCSNMALCSTVGTGHARRLRRIEFDKHFEMRTHENIK